MAYSREEARKAYLAGPGRKEALQVMGMSKGHRSQLEEVPIGQTWDVGA